MLIMYSVLIIDAWKDHNSRNDVTTFVNIAAALSVWTVCFYLTYPIDTKVVTSFLLLWSFQASIINTLYIINISSICFFYFTKF
jgi:hypothetical protein